MRDGVSFFRKVVGPGISALVLALGSACAAGAPQAGPPPGAGVSPSGAAASRAGETPVTAQRVGLVIHGGAGTIRREQMTPEREREYRAALTQALQAGHRILAAGGSSMDAVVAAINIMEDSPLFNAGRGAVFTNDGRNELDASIMDGRTLAAGAVAGVTRVRNPINLARAVMERSPHVMMAGAGAETFAEQQGLEMVAPEYFRTQARWDALQRARDQERIELSEDDRRPRSATEFDDFKFGTVGAVALDRNGNLAAGTSTGGMTNKRWGRIGDAPIIGAGTYANNRTCAVSATGHGEYFIRNVVAYDICALVEYRGMRLADAADAVVMEKLVAQRGEGGVIAMDQQGNIAMPFNTPGMYRGFIDEQGRAVVMLYRDDSGTRTEAPASVPAQRQ
jgi:L-asparaginase / beta-aspartyl-peptidase